MNIKNLLTQVSIINKQYSKLTNQSGEKFNIFDVLKLSTKEVRTHSALIGELLNPKGSHGQKDVFLKLFCNVLKIEGFNSSNGELEIEKHIGIISEDYTDGGYIDIIINDGEETIIIENKIYAGDQNNQLLRYHNYGLKVNKPFHLLYLTLHGNSPSDSSKGQLIENTNFNKISYAIDILKWLELCKEKSVNHPLLRETISQYIYLIKKLTDQTLNNQMNNEIVDILTNNGDNIKASIEIHNSLFQAKQRLLFKFGKKLEVVLNQSHLWTEVSENFGYQYNGIKVKLSVEANEYVILSFLSNLKDFYIEIVNENNPSHLLKDKNNIDFYKNSLNSIRNLWGRIENVDSAWNGDWVCRYSKLENLFYDSDTWAKIANDDVDDIVNNVAKDILHVHDALKNKLEAINV